MINLLKFLPKHFTTLRTPFTNFFPLNLLFQDTSYSLALKYSRFCLSFPVLHFILLMSGSKSVKFAQKFLIFLKFLTLEGTLVKSCHKPGKLLLTYLCVFHRHGIPLQDQWIMLYLCLLNKFFVITLLQLVQLQ